MFWGGYEHETCDFDWLLRYVNYLIRELGFLELLFVLDELLVLMLKEKDVM